jgi:uncharacterized membrane protein
MDELQAVGQRWTTGRIEAFSDGVFAIAITLLVLDIKIEPDGFDDLWRSLAREWPAYLAYVTSFLTVGAVWLAHHALFMRLRWVDPMLMRLNIVLLMAASFLPFPTSLLAEAFHASRDAERAAVVVYGATAFAIEALLGTAWRYATDHPELLHGEHGPPDRAPERQAGIGAGLYTVAIVVGVLVLPRLAAFAYLAVAVRSVLLIRGEGRLTPGRG